MLLLRIDDPDALRECVAVARRIVAASEDGTLRTVRTWIRPADPEHGIGPSFEIQVNESEWTSPMLGAFEETPR